MSNLQMYLDCSEGEVLIKALDMLKIGLEYKNICSDSPFEKDLSHKERYCTSSSLHRGFLNPSPVIDLLIGNLKRGQMRSQLPQKEKSYFRYQYNDHGQLICSQQYCNARISYTEHLYYIDDKVMGITIDCNGNLAAISEEKYVDNHILSFVLVNCVKIEDQYQIFSIHEEFFDFDNIGLCESVLRKTSPLSGITINKLYSYEHKDGYLISYTDRSKQTYLTGESKYIITKRRKV